LRSFLRQLLSLDFFPLRLDRFEDLVHIESHALRFYNELLDFTLKKPSPLCRRSRGSFRRNRCADPRTHLQPTFLNQILNHAVSGVRMDLEVRRQSADRRERLSRGELAADECFFRSVYHLIEDGFARLEREAY